MPKPTSVTQKGPKDPLWFPATRFSGETAARLSQEICVSRILWEKGLTKTELRARRFMFWRAPQVRYHGR